MEVHCFSSDFVKKHPLILDQKYTRTELIHAPVNETQLLFEEIYFLDPSPRFKGYLVSLFRFLYGSFRRCLHFDGHYSKEQK